MLERSRKEYPAPWPFALFYSRREALPQSVEGRQKAIDKKVRELRDWSTFQPETGSVLEARIEDVMEEIVSLTFDLPHAGFHFRVNITSEKYRELGGKENPLLEQRGIGFFSKHSLEVNRFLHRDMFIVPSQGGPNLTLGYYGERKFYVLFPGEFGSHHTISPKDILGIKIVAPKIYKGSTNFES